MGANLLFLLPGFRSLGSSKQKAGMVPGCGQTAKVLRYVSTSVSSMKLVIGFHHSGGDRRSVLYQFAKSSHAVLPAFEPGPHKLYSASIPRALPWADLLRPLRGKFSEPFRFQTPLFCRRRLKSVRMGKTDSYPSHN